MLLKLSHFEFMESVAMAYNVSDSWGIDQLSARN